MLKEMLQTVFDWQQQQQHKCSSGYNILRKMLQHGFSVDISSYFHSLYTPIWIMTKFYKKISKKETL